MNLGGILKLLRIKCLAASHDAGSNIVVGVLFLSLQTFQVPGNGGRTESAELSLNSVVDADALDDGEAVPTPATETVISCGVSGVTGVEGES